MVMKYWKIGLLAAAATVGLMTLQAQASTISIFNDTDINSSYTADYRANLTCNSCTVLTYSAGAYSFSGAFGELFDGPASSGDAAEATWINAVLGTSFTSGDVSGGKSTGSDGTTYFTSALYVILKIGKNPDFTIIQNTSG